MTHRRIAEDAGTGKDLSAQPRPYDWQSWDAFWSELGYDGLSLVFDVPLPAFQTLNETKKRALFRLFMELSAASPDRLPTHVQELEALPPDARLAALVDLSARFEK